MVFWKRKKKFKSEVDELKEEALKRKSEIENEPEFFILEGRKLFFDFKRIHEKYDIGTLFLDFEFEKNEYVSKGQKLLTTHGNSLLHGYKITLTYSSDFSGYLKYRSTAVPRTGYNDKLLICELLEKPKLKSTKEKDVNDEKCSVYLMKDEHNSAFKIGISNKPTFRESTLQSEKPSIILISSKEFPTRSLAKAFEKALHEAYSEFRLRGEWFSLDAQQVNDIISTLS